MNNQKNKNSLDQLKSQIEQHITDEEFCIAITHTKNAEEVCKLFERKNITASLDDINELVKDGCEAINKAACSDELTVENLDEIAGGSKLLRGIASVALVGATAFGCGCLCGVCAAFSPAAIKIVGGTALASAVWTAAG